MNARSNIGFALSVFVLSCVCEHVKSANGGFRTMQTGPRPLWNETYVDKLKKDLLMNYDRYARPSQHHNATVLRFGLGVMYLETDELKSAFTVHAWLRMIWNDPKLKWNEEDYGGISVIRISHHEIWKPDIFLYNSLSGGDPIVHFAKPHILIYPNGEVLWVPPTKLTAICEFNLRHWPFDTQHCHLKIGSWTHSGNDLEMKLYNNRRFAELEFALPYSAWNVSNNTAEIVTKYYPCCPEPYHYIHFNFTLVRKSAPYKAVVVTPAVVIALLILVQFWLLPQAQEKLMLNGFTMVTLVMFLVYFNEQVSPAGPNTPLIVLFYSASLCMVCVSMVGTVVVHWLSNSRQMQSLPWAIKKHLQGSLGKWLLLKQKFKETISVRHERGLDKAKDHRSHMEGRVQQDWMLALAIDRMFFIIYSFVYLVIAVIYLL